MNFVSTCIELSFIPGVNNCLIVYIRQDNVILFILFLQYSHPVNVHAD